MPSFSYTIKTSELDGKTTLPDGDVISLVEDTKGQRSPGVVTFTLEEDKGKWWKGIVFFEKSHPNSWEEIAAGSGDQLNDPQYSLKTGTIDHGKLRSGFLVLSKAKGFGIHSNVYQLQDADTALDAGKSYQMKWISD